ncbi:uncharacterized protein M421DRAFT_190143 [Didymella exigua CBS 183.55]|uniref:Uncharacterized protein n=1 Tax=Didymella exigua CBS 183.55 TaxID=1150837 RepID=A0A6A5S107_9PLEO|nr:uncharacterized protein M421DRAFT_190143 [Didymella exigua CBS 183.55]KAF1933124.1 hypothetical protein M421DRAFT_190143 [Didymella exigua CBS 183.55]
MLSGFLESALEVGLLGLKLLLHVVVHLLEGSRHLLPKFCQLPLILSLLSLKLCVQFLTGTCFVQVLLIVDELPLGDESDRLSALNEVLQSRNCQNRVVILPRHLAPMLDHPLPHLRISLQLLLPVESFILFYLVSTGGGENDSLQATFTAERSDHAQVFIVAMARTN